MYAILNILNGHLNPQRETDNLSDASLIPALFPDALWHIYCSYRVSSHTVELTRISEQDGNIMRETASLLQRFLGLNKGPGIFLHRRQEAVRLTDRSLSVGTGLPSVIVC
jgi:hypothetical protein